LSELAAHIRLATAAMAAAVLLVGCGAVFPDLDEALVVDLPGFVAVAPRPEPATLCDPDPARTDTTPPGLPEDLVEPLAASNYQQQISTVELYAWSTPESEAAIDDATTAAAACIWGPSGAETQTLEPWTGSGWSGIRILRTVEGTELVDRRLVGNGDVVVLVVVRADTDDPAETAPADDALAQVAENLR
jgi:hypothetical protein